MAERTIWQFGDKLIAIEDGSEATEEESKVFWERSSLQAECIEALKYMNMPPLKQKKDKTTERVGEWHQKYDQKIRDFFEIEDDCEIEHLDDDESLSYHLSTAIFDSVPDAYYPDGRPLELTLIEFEAFAEHYSDFKKYLDEMRETFPDIYADAVNGFLDGDHDT